MDDELRRWALTFFALIVGVVVMRHSGQQIVDARARLTDTPASLRNLR